MTDIRIERKSRFPWWAIIGALALLFLLGWLFLRNQPDRTTRAPGTTPESSTVGGAGLTLDRVIQDTGLPRQFSYGGLTWEATDVGRYEREGQDLIAVGPRIKGNELYYEQGTPTKPYQTLYLRGAKENYRDVYVRYKPAQGNETR